MGRWGVEHVPALGVCLVRLSGRVDEADILAAAWRATSRHGTARMIWDLSEITFELWSGARIAALLRNLAPLVQAAPELRIALVASGIAGPGVWGLLRDLVGKHRFPLRVALFPDRISALEWLEVMHLPVGA